MYQDAPIHIMSLLLHFFLFFCFIFTAYTWFSMEDADSEALECGSMPCFVGKCIDITQIPQYVREYDRGTDVELWQIKYNKTKL